MLGLALAAVQAALLLTVAVLAWVFGLSWGRVLQVTALVWVAAPVAGFLLCAAVHLRVSAAIPCSAPASRASRARPAADPCAGGRAGPATRALRFLTDAHGSAGQSVPVPRTYRPSA